MPVILPDWIIPTLGALGGSFFTLCIMLLGRLVRNRRDLLTYHVTHERIGVSTSDSIHGEILVTVGEHPVQNLYFSTIYLVNRSIRDIEEFEVKVYVGNGNHIRMITEQTHIEGTVEFLQHTESYENEIKKPLRNALANKEQAMAEQNYSTLLHRWYTSRDYRVPVISRDQTIRLTYMIDVSHNVDPAIFISCQKAGVRLKFKQPYQPIWHLWGVPLKEAGIFGIVVGIIVFFIVIFTIQISWIASLLCLITGMFANILGALLIKLYWWLRNRIIG